MSTEFNGSQMIDVVNELSLTAACLGNHEFDYGLDILDQRLAQSTFPWLNTNLFRNGQLIGRTAPARVVDLAFVNSTGHDSTTRVCFLGLSYDVRKSVNADKAQLGYADTVATAINISSDLRSKSGCKIVIALTHQTGKEDCVVSKSVDQIDLILGGHDHETVYVTNC